MALPVSPNPISFSQISTEFGLPSNQALSLGNIYVKTLFGDWLDPISMSSGHGKIWAPTSASNSLTSPGAGTAITVPAGAYRVSIKAWGAGGGAGGRGTGTGNVGGAGGSGGFVWGIYACSPGDSLAWNVGGYGIGGASSGISPYAAEGGGGGGASYVRNATTSTYYCIAAGGGGGGGTGSGTGDLGGPGGGAQAAGIVGRNNNADASSAPGQPGVASISGNGGSGASATGGTGTFLLGGQGGSNGTAPNNSGIGGGGDGGNNGLDGGGGGGGGGGWGSGGGGGWSANQGGGGGGGGSNYHDGLALLYSFGGSTGAIGSITNNNPLYGDGNWSNFGIGAPGRSTAGAGANGYNGAIFMQFYTS